MIMSGFSVDRLGLAYMLLGGDTAGGCRWQLYALCRLLSSCFSVSDLFNIYGILSGISNIGYKIHFISPPGIAMPRGLYFTAVFFFFLSFFSTSDFGGR